MSTLTKTNAGLIKRLISQQYTTRKLFTQLFTAKVPFVLLSGEGNNCLYRLNI